MYEDNHRSYCNVVLVYIAGDGKNNSALSKWEYSCPSTSSFTANALQGLAIDGKYYII
jgi:hypothetical protein